MNKLTSWSRFARQPTRLFDRHNQFWNDDDPQRNPLYVHYVKTHLNDILRACGYVSLNQAFELLGFERTVRGGQMGWVRDPDPDEGDGYIDFGVWAEGFTRGRDWLNGDLDCMRLYFNVDPVTVSMPRRIKKLRAEGKIV